MGGKAVGQIGSKTCAVSAGYWVRSADKRLNETDLVNRGSHSVMHWPVVERELIYAASEKASDVLELVTNLTP